MDLPTQVIISFVVLFILCLVCAIMAGFQKAQDDNDAGGSLYSRQTESPAFVGFTNFWSALIIFNSIIPISLYVSIEFVKTFQVVNQYHSFISLIYLTLWIMLGLLYLERSRHV